MTQTKKIQHYFTAVIIFLSISRMVCAQQPPQIDPSLWLLDTSRSDEFNQATLDTNKWWAVDPCNFTDSIYHGYDWSLGAHFRPENVSVNNGNVMLTVDYDADSLNDSLPCYHTRLYRFYSGGIQTKQTRVPGLGIIGNYTYGYYEMRAKLPGFYNSNNQPVGTGFWPNFWFYYEHYTGNCLDKHDEVDILEPDSYQFYDAKTNVVGWHDENGACGAFKIAQDSMRSTSPLFANYHKYAVELFRDKIIFYFDDQPYFSADTITSPQYIHSLNFAPYLTVVSAVSVGNGPYPLSSTPFPQNMYIDYFRYYTLKPELVTQDLLYQNYPNPINNTTDIGYSLVDSSAEAFINVYDVTGREIRSIPLTHIGKSKITLDCTNFDQGIYLCSLLVGNKFMDSKKLIVIRE